MDSNHVAATGRIRVPRSIVPGPAPPSLAKDQTLPEACADLERAVRTGESALIFVDETWRCLGIQDRLKRAPGAIGFIYKSNNRKCVVVF